MFARLTLHTARPVFSLALVVAFAATGCGAAGGGYGNSATPGTSAAPTGTAGGAGSGNSATPGASAAPAGTASGGRYGNSATPAPAVATGSVIVKTVTTTLGAVLVGPNGLTLYTHAGDSSTASTCSGGCAAAWPPLTVTSGSSATGGTGVSGSFGTLSRADGTIQVTYRGLPLYGWNSDTKAGDTTGEGVGGFSVARP